MGRAVALHHKAPLKFDTTIFETYKLHNGYRLNQFAIQAEIAAENEIINLKVEVCAIFCITKNWVLLRENLISKKNAALFRCSVFKNNFVYLDGYWQNELYFSNIRELLLKELSPNSSMNDLDMLIWTSIKKSNSLSLHVRRDYLNLKNINVLDVDYYLKAVDYIRKIIEKPTFYIFQTI